MTFSKVFNILKNVIFYIITGLFIAFLITFVLYMLWDIADTLRYINYHLMRVAEALEKAHKIMYL